MINPRAKEWSFSDTHADVTAYKLAQAETSLGGGLIYKTDYPSMAAAARNFLATPAALQRIQIKKKKKRKKKERTTPAGISP